MGVVVDLLAIVGQFSYTPHQNQLEYRQYMHISKD